ncbi:hypothetical protein CAPTEDRAFT_194815 [Capitella teleta]|uniref:Uncharacterized protein n=1 Tax=Capitella teleta TaxID=283909 RepID=R7UZI8_CAPTE|nr:hypothetical protein CAPTEDRAFT_194815 [Capitella teleta]|eukprot:ELU09382.1 hypothetical protein CAPTEDRAFT_194815 [Capitella teleta]
MVSRLSKCDMPCHGNRSGGIPIVRQVCCNRVQLISGGRHGFFSDLLFPNMTPTLPHDAKLQKGQNQNKAQENDRRKNRFLGIELRFEKVEKRQVQHAYKASIVNTQKQHKAKQKRKLEHKERKKFTLCPE